jgi:hypothetical protein
MKKRIKVRTAAGDFIVSCKLPARTHRRLVQTVAESDRRIARIHERKQRAS